VTGATGGIGSAVALDRAARGERVALASRSRDRLQALAAECSARGAATVEVAAIDLSTASAEEGLAELAGRVAPVDLVVHAAGSSPRGALDEIDDDAWWNAIQVKLLGAVRLVRAVRPSLAPNASIILVSGSAARLPSADYVVGAVNVAVEHLAKTLALELAPTGARVNAVSPGPTVTPRFEARCAREAAARGSTPEEVARELAAALPLGRLVLPADVAAAVDYLAGAAAVTGDVLAVTAGRTAAAL
jgi:NAD(P)-dependent dehydrogenase (short-subunit alcohol dehydrogenase family)